MISKKNSMDVFSGNQTKPVKFNVDSLSFGNAPSNNPNRWLGNKISDSTRNENIILATLLANSLENKQIQREITINDLNSFNGGKDAFEKSLLEVLKLLDKSRNSTSIEEKHSTPVIQDEKKKKETNDSPITQMMLTPQQQESSSIMRKPLRVIIQLLAKRIENLKSSQAEWDAFEKLVKCHRQEILDKNSSNCAHDIVELNKSVASRQERQDHINELVIKNNLETPTRRKNTSSPTPKPNNKTNKNRCNIVKNKTKGISK